MQGVKFERSQLFEIRRFLAIISGTMGLEIRRQEEEMIRERDKR
jgi:hypothetical protein